MGEARTYVGAKGIGSKAAERGRLHRAWPVEGATLAPYGIQFDEWVRPELMLGPSV